MQSIANRFEFNRQLKPYHKEGRPVMELIRQEPQVSTLMRENPQETEIFLSVLFTELNESFKVKPEFKLSENEVMQLVSDIIEKYYHYRIQDFSLFVKWAKTGEYGKAYNRLDAPMIFEWIKEYDAQRASIQEANQMRYKEIDTNERTSTKNKLNVEKMKLNLGQYTQIKREEKKENQVNNNMDPVRGDS